MATRKKSQPNLFTEPVRWFHVIADGKAFGFSSQNGFVLDHPRDQDWMKRQSLEELKPWIREHNAKVIEVKPSTNG